MILFRLCSTTTDYRMNDSINYSRFDGKSEHFTWSIIMFLHSQKKKKNVRNSRKTTVRYDACRPHKTIFSGRFVHIVRCPNPIRTIRYQTACMHDEEELKNHWVITTATAAPHKSDIIFRNKWSVISLTSFHRSNIMSHCCVFVCGR